MIPSAVGARQTGGMVASDMAGQDKQDKARKAADATDTAKADPAVDARVQHAAHLRAAKGAGKPSDGANKGRDARTVREGQGANAQRGNDQDVDQDEDKEEDEEQAKEKELFWKHLVFGAYRSKKRREEE
jgi:hypothetical protein